MPDKKVPGVILTAYRVFDSCPVAANGGDPGLYLRDNLGYAGSLQNVNEADENLKMPYLLLTKSDDKPQIVTIEEGTDDQVEAHGYSENPCKKCLFNISVFLTLGFILLVFRWWPEWKVRMTCTPCSVSKATVLILKDLHGSLTVVDVTVKSVTASLPQELVYSRSLSSISNHQQDSMNFNYSPACSYRYFIHNCVKFVWDCRSCCFKRLRAYDQGLTCADFLDKFHGLLAIEQQEKREIYGPNGIDIEVKSYFLLFFDEILNPFYIFQAFSVLLWLMDNYVFYAICILVITLISVSVALYETKKQRMQLRDMVAHSNAVVVTVLRKDGVYEDIPASNLVPGDVIVIPPHGCLMACDAVLIAGNCIVNESMLTGESIPETKMAIARHDDEMYSPLNHKRHTLFCGTQVIQTRYYENNKVLAVVLRTDRTAIITLLKRTLKRKLMQDDFKVRTFRGNTIAQSTHKVASLKFKHFSINACKRICNEPLVAEHCFLYAALGFCSNSVAFSLHGFVAASRFSTSKGELVRSILFPKPLGFKFYKDAVKFVVLLFFISAIGMGYSIYCYIMRDSPWSETLVRALDIITIVVPPALPAAMTIGTVYAQNRLKKQGIFCISPPRINIGGKLKLICFDKTGTLTEEGLDLWGIIPTSEGKFKELEHDVTVLSDHNPLKVAMASCHSLTMIQEELCGDPLDLKMFQATKWEFEEPGADTSKFDMLNPTVVRPSSAQIPPSAPDAGDTALVHEPGLDDKNLLSFPLSPTKDSSILDEMPYEVGIIRQFPFSSGLQRMSVICRTLGSKHMDLFCKGAPEKISSLCLPETVPATFPELLKDYALQGYRVIALAHRKLDSKLSWHHSQKVKRDQVEKDLTFLGLLVMQNTLKPETTPVIKVLKDAKIRCVMVTGDNLMTAMSVARDCHMIPETEKIISVTGTPPDHDNKPAQLQFEYAETPTMSHSSSTVSAAISVCGDAAPMLNHIMVDMKLQHYHFVMDGKAFSIIRVHFPEILSKILIRGTVFARMAPDQKTQLVESLQDVGYVVGMCGDGANDCGALKAADVGISLSEAEASVAAPFTSNIPNIRCVPIVIREGRCALVTSFSTFKFIALYSLTQFISVLILYTVDTNLTDQMFLYVDLGIITLLAVAMGYTGAYEKLVSQRPRSNLVSVPNVVSLLGQIIFIGAIQVGSILFLQCQKWFIPVDTEHEIFPCWENTVVFLVSCYQYIIIALIVSQGPPYRKHLYTNYLYLTFLFVLTASTTFLLFNPFPPLAKIMAIVEWQPTQHFMFRVVIFMVVWCNLFLALAFEMLVAKTRWLRWLVRFLKNKTEPKNEYKRIEKAMLDDYLWPPLDKPILSSGPILIGQ